MPNLPAEETIGPDRIWYFPHHGVTTEKKTLRVVFDCACKYKGKSLNDRCHSGPDLINRLLPVLHHFRQHSIAIQGEIDAMYNQVRIPSYDRDALRFLWYIDDKLEYFRMTSHFFGGVWCGASTNYALRRTISYTPNVDPLVEETVMKSFYVDDCLSSVNEVGAASTVIKETPKVLANGGFSLTKFAVMTHNYSPRFRKSVKLERLLISILIVRQRLLAWNGVSLMMNSFSPVGATWLVH